MAITTATWTAPIQWTASLAITKDRLNAWIGTGPSNLGGNLQYLYDYVTFLQTAKPSASFIASPSFNFTSTSFVTVSTSTCRLSITPSHTNAKVLVTGGCTFQYNGTGQNVFIDMLIDGSTYASGGSSVGTGFGNLNLTGVSLAQLNFSFIVTLATAVAHTLDLVVRMGGGVSDTVTIAYATCVEIS